MNVFVSWSGTKARRVALALKAFLQDVNQRIIAWFSDADISAGERWSLELATQLEATDFGIICVTKESLQSPWILFEAGALSKSVKGGRVCPYLIDVTRRELTGPLSQFQAKEATKVHTWEMLQSINLAMAGEALPEARLQRYFDTFWPTLEAELALLNRELQALPETLQLRLLETLPRAFYKVHEIEMFAAFADIPVWNINLNQAAVHVWRELIQVAVSEKKLDTLFEVLMKDYGGNPVFRELAERVHEWHQSLPKGDA